MAVLKPRERLVYFRISEDEFHQFLSMCEKEGARSLSDLARNAVQRLIAKGNSQRAEQDLTPKVEMLEKLIAEVSAQLELLTRLKVQTLVAEAPGRDANGSSSLTEEEQRKPPYGNPAWRP